MYAYRYGMNSDGGGRFQNGMVVVAFELEGHVHKCVEVAPRKRLDRAAEKAGNFAIGPGKDHFEGPAISWVMDWCRATIYVHLIFNSLWSYGGSAAGAGCRTGTEVWGDESDGPSMQQQVGLQQCVYFLGPCFRSRAPSSL